MTGMFHPNERFQVFCRWCYRKFEEDSMQDAVIECERHEQTECVKARTAAAASVTARAVGK